MKRFAVRFGVIALLAIGITYLLNARGGGESFIGGFAGGTMGGLLGGAISRSNSEGSAPAPRNDARRELNQLQDSVDELDARVGRVERAFKNDLTNLNEKLDTAASDVKKLKTENTELQTQVDATKKLIDQLQKKVDELERAQKTQTPAPLEKTTARSSSLDSLARSF